MILIGSVLMYQHNLLSPSRLQKYKDKHVYTKLSKNWWNDFITNNFVIINSFLNEFNKYFKEESKNVINL